MKLLRLQVGMSREEVLSITGEPDRKEMHGNVEVLFFRTELGGNPEDFMPVLIVNGQLVGWGRVAHEEALSRQTAPFGSVPKSN